ncbi:hypothetical protein COL65_08310 [Priestia aryabhattai]|uniref:hypothetical protein n=1 Tax=Priestia aryabhattai TaxID=412384 RepID=UPI000BF6726D|nr:hypothetical protein [Priestia aryabhattai]PGA19481.1 hypothetical protein COL65_08310 [Priestia aryabhattai]
MKRFLTILLLLLIITGCSNGNDNKLKWFTTQDKAINQGIKDGDLNTKENIVGEMKENGEIFVFYKLEEENKDIVIGIANIAKQNGKYAWYRESANIGIKSGNNPSTPVSWDTETQSGKKFTAYTGTAEDKNIPIETEGGEVTPKINEKFGVYYYIEPRK